MTDPFAVIGIASSITQLVDISSKPTSKSKKIYRSTNSALAEHTELEIVTTDLKSLTQKISSQVAIRGSKSASSTLSKDEVRLKQLVASC